MAHFLIRASLNEGTAKALVAKPHDRTRPAAMLIEMFGGKLNHYYFGLGEADVFALCEFPDAMSAMACSLKAMSTGAFRRFETTPLLTAQEGEAAMRKAHDAGGRYTAPNA